MDNQDASSSITEVDLTTALEGQAKTKRRPPARKKNAPAKNETKRESKAEPRGAPRSITKAVSKSTAKSANKRTAKPAKVEQRSAPRQSTTNRSEGTSRSSSTNRGASLRVDLKKFAKETYETTDFTRGAILVLQREGVEVLRDIILAILASKTPVIGGRLSENAMDGLIDKLVDDYRKLKVVDRKALRAIINWVSGSVEADAAAQQHLWAALKDMQPSSAGASGSASNAKPNEPAPKLKPLRK